MRKLILTMTIALLALPAFAAEGDEIKAGHREAAQRFLESFDEGLELTGDLTHNESEGSFEAYFYGDEWLVAQHFGSLSNYSYSNSTEMWSGSNYSLPFKLEPEDNPASITMNLISTGRYLEEPYWDHFTYEGEDAGGFNFTFAPPGMPKVELVLYSDPEEQQYLQIMSSEIALAESDPTSIRYRSFYYYEFSDDGRILTSRETGREIDNEGETVNFMDFAVNEHQLVGERPEELTFDTSRTPVGTASETLPGPVAIPVDVDKGYFLVPMNFEGSDQTYLFLFDTGATAALLNPEAAVAAGLVPDRAVVGHGHGSRSNFELGMCTTASIGEAGSEAQAPLAGFPATRISEENTAVLDALEWYGASGILGISPLYQYVVGFDHINKQIICYPPSMFDKDQNLETPNLELWLDVEDLIYAKGRLADQIEGEVIIDTGLQQDLAILRETAEANDLKLEKVKEGTSTVLGGVRSFDYVKVPSFELGPLRMEDKVASLTDDDRGSLSARGLLGFVGITMFFGVRVTLDLFDQRMYIEDPLGSGLFDGLLPGGEPPADQAPPEDEEDGLETIISQSGMSAPGG